MTSGYRERVGIALRLLAVREGGTISQERLAERVGTRANKTYTQSAAKGWLKGVVPTDLESQLALALELGVDPGWLYFFPFSKAPAPMGAELASAAEAGRVTPVVKRTKPAPRGAPAVSARKSGGGRR